MHPYQPGKPISTVKRELGLDNVVKLASNENPYGPSPKAVAAIRAALDELNLYPDGAAYELKESISKAFYVPMDQIAVGNGSDEIIGMLAQSLIADRDDEILTAECSFPRYAAAAELAPCRLIKVPLKEWRFDLPAMTKAINDHTRIVYVANPNNPTGTIVTKGELASFARDLPETVLLVVDEAYFEFARTDPEYPDAREMVLAGRNVAALRTFSKAHGLAGLRVGYGFMPSYLVDAIDRVRSPFHVNSLAQVAAIAAIGDDDHVCRTVASNAEGMKMLRPALEALGCGVVDSWANFLFVDLKRPAAEVYDALLRRGYIVRPVGGAPSYVRITIGSPDENRGLIEAFRSLI